MIAVKSIRGKAILFRQLQEQNIVFVSRKIGAIYDYKKHLSMEVVNFLISYTPTTTTQINFHPQFLMTCLNININKDFLFSTSTQTLSLV